MDHEEMTDFDYESIQRIVEEEEKNRRLRKEQEDTKKKTKDQERDHDRHRDSEKDRDKDKYRSRDHREKDRDNKDRSHRDRKEDSRTRHRSRTISGENRRQERKDRKNSRSHSKEREYLRRKELEREKEREKMLVEKTINEARRQALEAQRDDCTILVYRLHLDAKEKDIFKFFAEANIGRIKDIKVIRDPRTSKSKGAAYVEFENQDSVVLAAAMSGHQICGQSIVIQHSQAHKNREAAAAKYKKDMIREQQRVSLKKSNELPENIDGPMKIYVGGLTENLADITDSDIRSIFHPFGEIDLIELPKDPLTSKCRGYCFISYRKASQAKAAMNAMNGFYYKGKILKVGVATESARNVENMYGSLDDNEGDAHNYLQNYQSKQTFMQKLSRDGNLAGVGYQSLPMTSGDNDNNLIQSSFILLSNLFEPSEVNLKEDPDYFNDVRRDVLDECNSLGTVEAIRVDSNSKGNVWIKFADNNSQAAKLAVAKFHSRWFSGRQVVAKLISESFYEENVMK